MMRLDYNDFSEIQLAGATKTSEILCSYLLSSDGMKHLITSHNGGPKLTVADYGCAGGKNSLLLMQMLFKKLQERFSNLEMHAVLTDLPQNDFNNVFRTYFASTLSGEKNFSLTTGGGSAYGRILSSASLDLVVSTSTLHWISHPVGNDIRFKDPACRIVTCADPVQDSMVVEKLLKHTKNDLQNFLLSRSAELKSDGLLIFSCTSYTEGHLIPTTDDDSKFENRLKEEIKQNKMLRSGEEDFFLPAVHTIAKSLGHLLHKTQQQFHIPSYQSDNEKGVCDIIPIVHRSRSDIVDAISSHPELVNTFSILHNDIHDVGNSIWENYITGVYTEDELVAKMTGFIRAWSESFIREMLHHNDNAVTWFYEEMMKQMKEEKPKWSFENRWLIVVLQKN
jgi:hypothetical protein